MLSSAPGLASLLGPLPVVPPLSPFHAPRAAFKPLLRLYQVPVAVGGGPDSFLGVSSVPSTIRRAMKEMRTSPQPRSHNQRPQQDALQPKDCRGATLKGRLQLRKPKAATAAHQVASRTQELPHMSSTYDHVLEVVQGEAQADAQQLHQRQHCLRHCTMCHSAKLQSWRGPRARLPPPRRVAHPALDGPRRLPPASPQRGCPST